MKHLIIIIAGLVFINCKAQTPVVPLYDRPANYGDIANAYYKDLADLHGQFVGTWIYTNGTMSIKVVFQKRNNILQNSSSTPFYVDFLVGEIQYIDAGLEKLNTLNNLAINYPDNIWNYDLVSMGRTYNTLSPICSSCPIGVAGMNMYYSEPDNDDFCLEACFKMYPVIESGVQKLKVNYYLESVACGANKDNMDNPSTKTDFIVPHGEYTFVKQ